MPRPSFCPWDIPGTTMGKFWRLREAWIQILDATGLYRAMDRLNRIDGDAEADNPVISVTPKGFTFQRCVVARVKQDDEAICLYSLVDPGDTVLIAPRFFHKDCRVVALGGGWLICELPPSRTRDAITSTLQWLRSVLRVWRWY